MNDLFKVEDQLDENTDYYNELVGEGRKFRDNQALAKAKVDSDNYIRTLESKIDQILADHTQLQSDYRARASLEELLQKLDAAQSNAQPEVKQEQQQPQISTNDISELVQKQIRASEQEKLQQGNMRYVQQKLTEHYGERFQNAFKQQVDNLGLSEEFVTDLAKNHPEVLLRTIGVGQQQQSDGFQAPPRSSQRSDSFSPRGPKKRTWSYYQEMKKNDPKSYYSKENTVQMHKDAIEMGDAFNDGDFYSV